MTMAQAMATSAVAVRHGFAVRDPKHRGLANLIINRTPEENARALAACRIAAWYAPGLEILYTIYAGLSLTN